MSDLVEAMKKAALQVFKASKPLEVLYGTVLSVEPIKISVEQKLSLESEQLILSKNVTDHEADITRQTEDGYMQRNRIIIHNGLGIGDRVILIRLQGGQKYLVVDKKV